ncbi:lysine N(6)-hydroxylase/L-ornithine N(5)-oxygenase family protein [Saccharopolyspora sp. K220]|uniref:lysine N(6)-hydroxylase/L-ornithine N(5)-oxygenase family protein n=1 Tax=Saccharopolyspora soli TaxID=2926618 RepID=UPI001F5A890C|nr:lysine N(6)-hydroxylase/L-ornithine N(5)-oxygenase family protein [Saccharopolyspora soli]MCI2417433.1 lysine N(6)-hydroxylase/L-ornithine N(5)-oxygenase family protein [Saccharopolyspora soli]
MSEARLRSGTPVYDLVGVGFGPSNLALAIAVSEHNAAGQETVTAHFLERQERFGWHRGMLIDDATMQVSFLKDLVTQRNPASRFSFLSYLHAQDRLVDFINHKSLFPLRIEFHDYFEWAAAQVDDMVSYGHDVVAVRPVLDGAELALFDVETATGEVYRARNVVVATGLRPRLPDGVAASDRVWHNCELLHRVDGVEPDEVSRFVVVGAGQSAAEVTAFLHERFPNAEVCSVFARFGYSPADDSPFANRVFDPAAVDAFYGAPEDVKRQIMAYHANTNYSVVDLDLIEELYRRVYREKVLGGQRLRILNVSRVADVAEADNGVRVTVDSLSTGERTVLDADVVVCSTGYQPSDALPLLGDVAHHCARDEQDRLLIERDYRVRTAPAVTGGVYLQGGCTEHTHGITSSLLSNNAVRSGEILQSVLDRRRAWGNGRTAAYAVSGNTVV